MLLHCHADGVHGVVQEVIGSAIAILLLSRGAIPVWAGVLISAASSFLLLLIERIGQRALEGLFGIMIGTMVAAFAVSCNGRPQKLALHRPAMHGLAGYQHRPSFQPASTSSTCNRCVPLQFMFSRAHVPSRDVAAGFLLPRLPRENIPQAVALLGSLIMPHK